MERKETYVYKGTNAAAISSGVITAIQDISNAGVNDNLPHNALTLTNLSDTVEIYIFLDDASQVESPDYVLFPNTSITIEEREGVHYHTVFIKNTHGANDIAINELKYRLSTVKKVNE